MGEVQPAAEIKMRLPPQTPLSQGVGGEMHEGKTGGQVGTDGQGESWGVGSEGGPATKKVVGLSRGHEAYKVGVRRGKGGI